MNADPHPDAPTTSTPESIAAALGLQPIYLVPVAGDRGVAIGKWRLAGPASFGGPYPAHILAVRVAGSAAVTRRSGRRTTRKRPRIGSVTWSPADGHLRWSLEEAFETLHLYLPHERVERFVHEQLDAAPGVEIDDFFALEDPWLQGFFQMLASELETCQGQVRPADPLLLDFAEHLVLRHLLRWHSSASRAARRGLDQQARVSPLRPVLQRRVEEFVAARLDRDIALPELAALACLSVDHFVRAFRAACGLTPYQFVLEQRLRRAASLLRAGEAPVRCVATASGFRSASSFSTKFHARFGLSPSEFRRRS